MLLSFQTTTDRSMTRMTVILVLHRSVQRATASMGRRYESYLLPTQVAPIGAT